MQSRYNLKLIAKHNKTRIKKFKPIQTNELIEAEYYGKLKRMVLFMHRNFINIAVKGMKPDIKKLQDESYSTKLDRLIKEFKADTDLKYSDKELKDIVEKLVFKTDKYQKLKFRKASEYGFGIDIENLPDFAQYRQFINSTVQKNVAAIKYLREETQYKLEMSLRTAIQKGKSIEQVTSEIMSAGQITLKRAAGIARNEIKNITRELSQKRAVNAGFDVYEWLGAEDSRERGNPNGLYPNAKPSHWIMNGMYCKYSDDTVYSSNKGKTWKKRTSKMPKGKPGNEINCFLPNSQISLVSKPLKLYKRFYTGSIMEITDKTGISISVTPNHPVLTNRGWVFAKNIKHSDKLIKSLLSYNSRTLSTQIDNNHIMITDDIYNFFKVIFASQRVAGINVKFHGDISNQEVEIIDLKRCLTDRGKTSFDKKIKNSLLSFTHFRKSVLFNDSSFVKFFETTLKARNRFVSFPDLVSSLDISHSVPLVLFRFALVSDFDFIFNKNASNNISGSLKLFRDLIFAYARNIEINDFSNIKVYSLNGLPCVESSIKTITHKILSSNVYNLETEDSLYMCNGIVNHNCRCVDVPVFI
jgi:hypothetical protein